MTSEEQRAAQVASLLIRLRKAADEIGDANPELPEYQDRLKALLREAANTIDERHRDKSKPGVDLTTVECYVHGDLRARGGQAGGGHRWSVDAAERRVPAPWRCPDQTLVWNAEQNPYDRGQLGRPRDRHIDHNDQIEGEACLRRCDGWTCIAWWDRSGDHRPGSNTVLLAHADLQFEEMVELLRLRFPWIAARQNVPLRERPPLEPRP